MANSFLPTLKMNRAQRHSVLWEVLDIADCLTQRMSLGFQRFLGKIRRISELPHPISRIIYSVRSLASSQLWLSAAVSPLPPLPPSTVLSVCQLSGSTWPELLSVSYGSWWVAPSPLNTDWLAGRPASYLHSGRRVPGPLSLHAAVLSELGETLKNAAREQI